MGLLSRVVSQHKEYTLCDEIESFSEYKEFIEELGKATELDVVTLKIASSGGRIDVGRTIVEAIKKSKAIVTAEVISPSYSMASLIAISCDNLILNPHTFLMFHNYSSYSGGKGNALVQQVTNINELLLEFFTSICKPFLTPREIKLVANDKDVYINWDDDSLPHRISRHFRSRGV